MQQGLRQGDPLSPLLYNLIGEMLHQFLEKACSKGIFQGVRIPNSQEISHLQFADDTILFIKDSTESVMGIKAVLKLFEVASGLKINFHKSFVYGTRENAHQLCYWATLLGSNVGTWPINYLGATLGNSPRNINFWEPLIQNFHSKMKKWRTLDISMAGRIILLGNPGKHSYILVKSVPNSQYDYQLDR